MDLTRKRTLVVDERPGMLASLKRALEACGIRAPHAVRSAREAASRLRNMRYDIVLADYELGPGPDGQQLLEHVRKERLLAPGAVFLIVTAERTYERVMSAAELMPDDYLVKPFTEATLRQRLQRALERKSSLASVLELQARGELAAALAACEASAAADAGQGLRHAAELERLRGEILLGLGRFAQARAAYEAALEERATPWARLGLARALEGLECLEEARTALTELLADAPEYLAAYDALSALHARCRNESDARAVLAMALEVSPNAVHRQKAVGAMALKDGDLEAAENAYASVVRKGRHGFDPNPDDHLALARIYLDRGKYPQALETLAETKKTFARAAEVQACACAVESLVHTRAENPRDAQKALDEALAMTADGALRLPNDIALELARACYLNRRETEGAALVSRLVSNDHDNPALLGEVRQLYAELDRAEQGEHLIERCVSDAVRINNDGVALAKGGDLAGAIDLLVEAAHTRPDNPHIVMNAAHALVTHMQLTGIDAGKRAQVEAYLRRVGERHPEHPKYLQVARLYRSLLEEAAQPEEA